MLTNITWGGRQPDLWLVFAAMLVACYAVHLFINFLFRDYCQTRVVIRFPRKDLTAQSQRMADDEYRHRQLRAVAAFEGTTRRHAEIQRSPRIVPIAVGGARQGSAGAE